MEEVFSFDVDDHKIIIKKVPLKLLLENDNNFNGQKLMHPFKFNDKNCYSNEFTSEGVKDDFQNIKEIHVKHDGACGLMYYDAKEKKYIPYTRYDIKKNKKTGKFGEPQDNWIECEPKPTSDGATHWAHFRSAYEDNKAYKWQIAAFDSLLASQKLNDCTKSFTCEYMGKKCNYTKTDPVDLDSCVIPHGSLVMEVPKELHSFEGFYKLLQSFPIIEGVVIYCEKNVYKIRRNMYADENNKRLEWDKKKTPQDYGFTIKGCSNFVIEDKN